MKTKCKQCQKIFSQKQTCIRHIKEDHLGINVKEVAGKKIVKCEVCSNSVSKKSLKRHLLSHSKENSFKCETCDVSFTRKDGLNRHLKNIHV